MSECGRCGHPVYFAEAVQAIGQHWHRACFVCSNASCSRSLDSRSCNDNNNKPYCNHCYKSLFGPKGVGYGIGSGVLSTATNGGSITDLHINTYNNNNNNTYNEEGYKVAKCEKAMSTDPSTEYDFLPAAVGDEQAILELTLKEFLSMEPHAIALGITEETGGDFIHGIVSQSIKCQYSIKILHKQSGKLIGARLMTVGERDKEDNDEVDVEPTEDGVQVYGRIIKGLKSRFWMKRQEANKVLRREIAFVHRDHQNGWIAQHLLHLGLEFNILKQSGFDGIISEASSCANQTLLKSNGYQEVARSQPEDYVGFSKGQVEFPDDTKDVKLMYLNLH